MALFFACAVGAAHADDENDRGEPTHWRAGNWYNGYHAGHNGWWWIVDGNWTYYPSPSYPFPDPAAAVPTDAAPVVVETPAPVAAPAADAQAVNHYYCPDPVGYYPSVPQCNAEWQKVDSDPSTGAPINETQAADAQEFQTLSSMFDAIDPTGQQAPAKLSELTNEISAYRQALYRRAYNAMALLEKAEILQHHVTEMQNSLPKTTPSQPSADLFQPALVSPPTSTSSTSDQPAQQ
jgi:hypothetical protein